MGKARGQQWTHRERKGGWKTSRSCGRSTALWKACTHKSSRLSRWQWVPNRAVRKEQPSLRCPLVCLHEKKSLNCLALDRDVQCAKRQFANSCEELCETPRILKAAGSIIQKRSFHFQNWSRSKVGKNVFRQPDPLLTKETLPLFPRYWAQGRYSAQIFIPLPDTTHRLATDSEKALLGWVHLNHSSYALWKEATKTVRVRIPGSLGWNGLCINETRTMALSMGCQCGRGKIPQGPTPRPRTTGYWET